MRFLKKVIRQTDAIGGKHTMLPLGRYVSCLWSRERRGSFAAVIVAGRYSLSIGWLTAPPSVDLQIGPLTPGLNGIAITLGRLFASAARWTAV